LTLPQISWPHAAASAEQLQGPGRWIEKNNELFFPLPLREVEKKVLVNVEEVWNPLST
jgi:hypothetical protein